MKTAIIEAFYFTDKVLFVLISFKVKKIPYLCNASKIQKKLNAEYSYKIFYIAIFKIIRNT